MNGNRTVRGISNGPPANSTFDAQDRLLHAGSVAYAFDRDGFLAQRGSDTFQYSARGELLSATIGSQTVTYAYDGMRRRVARTDVAGTQQYLYGNLDDRYQVTATKGPDASLSEYFYDEGGRLFAFRRDGAWYYVASDQVGTPRLVVDAGGAVVKVVEYDTFGVRTSDSNPGFALPIGFAGGLEDAATALIRFGVRDYEAQSGRWTARDPLFFKGGQINLYAYVGNYPVGLRDPSGMVSVDCLAWRFNNPKDGFDFRSGQQRSREVRDKFFKEHGRYDKDLRDADHYLFSREQTREAGLFGFAKSLGYSALAVGYTLAKSHCLTCLNAGYWLLGEDTNTSPASFSEIYWGVRGAWDASLDRGSTPPSGCDCK